MSEYQPFFLEDGLFRYLEPIRATGLYGSTDDEVLNNLVRIGVQQAVVQRVVPMIYTTTEAVHEAPAKPRCATCLDMWTGAPGTVCPTCGEDAIPF
jgi:hypothetical protein